MICRCICVRRNPNYPKWSIKNWHEWLVNRIVEFCAISPHEQLFKLWLIDRHSQIDMKPLESYRVEMVFRCICVGRKIQKLYLCKLANWMYGNPRVYMSCHYSKRAALSFISANTRKTLEIIEYRWCAVAFVLAESVFHLRKHKENIWIYIV